MLQLLLAARKRLGLTQQGMADKLGISRNYLALIETGKRRVPPKVADQIVTMQQDIVTTTPDQPNGVSLRPISVDSAAARIADLERQLERANETIASQARTIEAMQQGRTSVAPVSGACGGDLHKASARHERKVGA